MVLRSKVIQFERVRKSLHMPNARSVFFRKIRPLEREEDELLVDVISVKFIAEWLLAPALIEQRRGHGGESTEACTKAVKRSTLLYGVVENGTAA